MLFALERQRVRNSILFEAQVEDLAEEHVLPLRDGARGPNDNQTLARAAQHDVDAIVDLQKSKSLLLVAANTGNDDNIRLLTLEVVHSAQTHARA